MTEGSLVATIVATRLDWVSLLTSSVDNVSISSLTSTNIEIFLSIPVCLRMNSYQQIATMSS